MTLRETIDIHSENHTKNKEELRGKLWIFLKLEQVMHNFKLGFKLLTIVLRFLCSEFFIMVLDILLVANKPNDSQIPLQIGLLF
jgi:hypothetical protein